MSNAHSIYKNSNGFELKIFLDIDLKSDLIQDFYYKGDLSSLYQLELEELKLLIMNHSYTDALKIKRDSLKNEVRLSNNERPVSCLSLWLVHQAIENYIGTKTILNKQKDLLCLCFGIGKSEIKNQILKRPDYDLQKLIAETMATSACGSCLEKITNTMKDLRAENGLVFDLEHSQTRLDKNGNWIKIKEMYPGDLLIKLDQVKKIWMEREGIVGQFEIEIVNIEGHHLWLSVNPSEEIERSEKILLALSEFWRSEIGALFFLHLAL